jgi:hypothetical protein
MADDKKESSSATKTGTVTLTKDQKNKYQSDYDSYLANKEALPWVALALGVIGAFAGVALAVLVPPLGLGLVAGAVIGFAVGSVGSYVSIEQFFIKPPQIEDYETKGRHKESPKNQINNIRTRTKEQSIEAKASQSRRVLEAATPPSSPITPHATPATSANRTQAKKSSTRAQ